MVDLKDQLMSSFNGMNNDVRDDLAKMLAKWLYKDFGILIEAPSEDQIAKTLEEHDGRKETSKA